MFSTCEVQVLAIIIYMTKQNTCSNTAKVCAAQKKTPKISIMFSIYMKTYKPHNLFMLIHVATKTIVQLKHFKSNKPWKRSHIYKQVFNEV